MSYTQPGNGYYIIGCLLYLLGGDASYHLHGGDGVYPRQLAMQNLEFLSDALVVH
jgi:hypothetical protein